MNSDPASTGIYLRGKLYWLAHQRNRKRVYVSLETSDYAEAVRRSAEIRDLPELNPGGLLHAEIERFIAYKVNAGEYTRATARNAGYFLGELPKVCGDVAPFQVTKRDAQKLYDICRYDFRRPFTDYMAAQGCKWVTAHTMRRTFASIQASKGTSLYIIATWLGDDIETTRRHYGHLIPAHETLEGGLG